MAELVSDRGLVLGVLGLTTVQLIDQWQKNAPTLEEVRKAPKGDPAIQQRLMDANYLAAGMALLIGGTTAYLVKSWLPVIMAVGSVVLVSQWFQMVYNSDDSMMTESKGNDNGPRYPV